MLVIDKESEVTLYAQIYSQLRQQIIGGTLPEGSMLPSTRNLAKMLQISRNTVESAYQQLFAEGYISSKACSGFIVEKIDSYLFDEIDSPAEKYNGLTVQENHENGFDGTRRLNFQYGRLSFSDFPSRTFRKIAGRILSSDEISSLSTYNNRKGEQELRVEIMKYLHESRGVICVPEQIILCSGTLTCISLICQLLMGKSHCVAMEEPCYDSVRIAFKNNGFQIDPVPVDRDGIDVSSLECTTAKAVYVTPSHQFPTGVVMSVNKRLGLIDWAERNDAYIIEDDYDSELRYNSRPIPSMQSLDRKGRVIYIDTFSKTLAPAMRLSFMVLPMTLMEKYQQLFARYNCPVPWLEQKILHAFIKEGHWNRHLRKINLSYKRRHDILISAITDMLGDRVVIHGKNAGLHILLEVNNKMSETELIERAGQAGVTVYPVSNYYTDRCNYSDNMILLGFSSLSDEEISEGIRLLKDAWFPQ